MHSKFVYGSVEYYSEHFSDILADVDGEKPETVQIMMDAFYRALDNWFDYHSIQANAYAELRQRVRKALTVS